MRSIWCFELGSMVNLEPQEIWMPEGAKIIFFAYPFGIPTIFAEVDTDAVLVCRRFVLHGTDVEIPHSNYEYVRSSASAYSDLIYHLYEVLSPPHRRSK
jgi:hypothetical protein